MPRPRSALPLALAVVGTLFALALVSLAAPVAAQGSNQPPTASFTSDPERPRAGQAVAFNSTSSDPDGRVVNWTWRLPGAGGAALLAWGPRVTHAFPEAGDYLVELTVLDDSGQSALVGQRVTVVPNPLEAPVERDALSFLPAWLFWVMPLLVSSLLFILAYLVVSKGQPAVYNLVFFLFYTTSGLKSLTEALAVLTPSQPRVHATVITLNAMAAYVLIPLFLWFVLVFPRPILPWLRDGKRGAVVLLFAVPFGASHLLELVPFDTQVNAFNGFVSVVALGCLGLLVYHGWETDSEEERRRIRLLTYTFSLLVFSALVLAVLNLLQSRAARAGDLATADNYIRLAGVFGLVLSPFLELVGATILLYAILRYQLLGIESLVLRITRGTVTAVTVPATFVVVSNSIEQLFQTTVLQGVRFDYIIAGFISAFLMVPVQKWTTFVIHRIFPGTALDEPHEQAQRRMEIFEAQLRYCLLDGALNEKEIGVLRRLRSSIGLQPDELRSVAGRFPGVDAARLA